MCAWIPGYAIANKKSQETEVIARYLSNEIITKSKIE